MARNAAAVMMKAMGARLSPCTQPMPQTVVMASGAESSPSWATRNVLTRPMRGWSRNSHPIAEVKPGMIRPSVISVNNSVLPGKSVRSASHAAGTPKASAVASVASENQMVLTMTRIVNVSPNTAA